MTTVAETETETETEPAAVTEPEPDTEPEPVPDPAPEPEPEHAITPESLRKAERAIADQRKRLAQHLGDDYVAHECLLCAGVGFLPELPPLNTVFQLREEGGEVRFMVQEPVAEPAYKQASDKDVCPECDGYGQTLTGAKTTTSRLWQCGQCGGSGFIMKGSLPVAPQPPFPQPTQPVPTGLEPATGGVPDAWGRPTGHPHWGVDPAMVPV